MEAITRIFQQNPELGIFLALACGITLGKIKCGHFKLGMVVGTMISGMVIGALVQLQVPDLVKWAFFDLFLFAIGYSAGPQFFRGLKKGALPQIVLAVVVAVMGLASGIALGKLFGFDLGTTAGLFCGGMTASATIGTATNAIETLPLAETLRRTLADNIPLVYAITYPFSEICLIIFLTGVGLAWLRISLKERCRELEAQLGGGKSESETDTFSTYHIWVFRAYRVTNPRFAHLTVAEFEASFHGQRVFVEQLRHEGRLLDPSPTTVINSGDAVAIAARRDVHLKLCLDIGPEVDDRELLDFPAHVLDVVVTDKAVVGKSLIQLAQEHPKASRGVILRKLVRGGVEIPWGPNTTLDRGDLLQFVGAREQVEQAARLLGYPEFPTEKSDLVYLAIGIVVGILLGLLGISIGGVSIGLGTSGAVLVVGLVFGWARSRYPVFGLIPEAAQQLLMDVGLTVFIAAVGLNAGPHALEILKSQGLSYFFTVLAAGLIVNLSGPVVALVVGARVLKMNPVLLLGGIAGAHTTTPAILALKDRGESTAPVLGYTVPYAVGNILLTLGGPVVVLIMAHL